MPDSFEELFDRAQRALAAGWAEQALVPATGAVKLAPQHAGARLLLARAWLGNQGFPRAISDARAALDLAPTTEQRAAALEVIGRASLRTKDVAQAEAALRETRTLGPTPIASVLLAAILCETGKTGEVAAFAREEAARLPEDERWDAVRGSFDALAAVAA